MNILFITEIKPFPPNSGERIRSFHLIRSLLEFTDKLFLLSGNAPPDEEGYKKIVHYQFPDIYTSNRWKNLILLFKRDRTMVSSIKRLLETNHIDLVFLDYSFIGNYIRLFKERKIKIIYGTHNVQSKLN